MSRVTSSTDHVGTGNGIHGKFFPVKDWIPLIHFMVSIYEASFKIFSTWEFIKLKGWKDADQLVQPLSQFLKVTKKMR